jgi:hypothetical protein
MSAPPGKDEVFTIGRACGDLGLHVFYSREMLGSVFNSDGLMLETLISICSLVVNKKTDPSSEVEDSSSTMKRGIGQR